MTAVTLRDRPKRSRSGSPVCALEPKLRSARRRAPGPDPGKVTRLSGSPRRRHVVFANWRDSRHPQAGGAELYCESVARRLARQGTQVTLLTSRPPGTARTETVEGVEVRRRGGTFTVYLHALSWLARKRRSMTR